MNNSALTQIQDWDETMPVNMIRKIQIIRTTHKTGRTDVVTYEFVRPDGMYIGSVEHKIARFGIYPESIITRLFVDVDLAVRWLKLKICQEIGRTDIDFVVVEKEEFHDAPLAGAGNPRLSRM